MATINIDNLRPAGAELFDDSEGFMDKLSNDEIGSIYGGSNGDNIQVQTNAGGTCTCRSALGFAQEFALSEVTAP